MKGESPPDQESLSYPKLTRPEGVGLCLALLFGGGAVTLWLIAGYTDHTPSSLILPYLAAVIVAAVAAWLIYRWGVRRLAEGKRMPQPARRGRSWASAREEPL